MSGGEKAELTPRAETTEIAKMAEISAGSGSKTCIVCCDVLKFVTVAKCNHLIACALCTLKLRLMDKDVRCVLRKQAREKVFITTDMPKTYDRFVSWGRC